MSRRINFTFIEFIEHVMATVPPEQKAIMVLDNASYHRSRAALAALSLFEARLHSVWLSKYCHFLNANERFWLHLKSLAAANHLHHSLDSLIQAIDITIQQQNQPDFPDRLDFAKNFQLTA